MNVKLEFKEEDFTEDELALLRLAFKLADDVAEQHSLISNRYLCNELYSLKEKLGIHELVE